LAAALRVDADRYNQIADHEAIERAPANVRETKALAYLLNPPLTDANFVFSDVPIAVRTAMITTEISAAMRPYSIAVAPDSSVRNFRIFVITNPVLLL
jgi:hypothetical protein